MRKVARKGKRAEVESPRAGVGRALETWCGWLPNTKGCADPIAEAI